MVDAVFAVAVDGRLDVNVALNRPSYQVSTWTDVISPYSYGPNYANDGGHGTNMWSGPCSVTWHATNPWWAVDLLVPLYVAGVKFTNRDSSGTSADLWLFSSVTLQSQSVTFGTGRGRENYNNIISAPPIGWLLFFIFHTVKCTCTADIRA